MQDEQNEASLSGNLEEDKKLLDKFLVQHLSYEESQTPSADFSESMTQMPNPGEDTEQEEAPQGDIKLLFQSVIQSQLPNFCSNEVNISEDVTQMPMVLTPVSNDNIVALVPSTIPSGQLVNQYSVPAEEKV